ncbi:LOW QUALITY PROTEIN: tigger transposable element-derived protein 6 [Drosophila gunungcola]|uniref:LOW QUALITY PROTEIN: tigger transposable element-derived protein 6 n=1 Tax=Drosophila gunungcola TaxID=103775 RepID=UPI0022DFC96E|nr:LOW QUALITY PROTEIN: tigger transposable element-derived protein 6 [Drosophila gunungcola]
MDMLPRRPRKPKKRLNLEEKMEVIRTHEQNKLTVRDLAKRFNIGKTQAAEILKHKDSIREGLTTGELKMSQMRRNPLSQKGAQIDELCFDWFSRARVDNIAISGEMVREKAKQIAEEVGHDGFLASSGWLQKWRIRHNIAYNATGDSLELQEFEAVLVKSEPISNRDDDDEPSPVQLLGPIISIDEAMIQLARLKEFARDDFVSYQQLLSLENQWSWKWNNFKKEVP